MKHLGLILLLTHATTLLSQSFVALSKNHPLDQPTLTPFIEHTLTILCPGISQSEPDPSVQKSVYLWKCPTRTLPELNYIEVRSAPQGLYRLSLERIDYVSGQIQLVHTQSGPLQWQDLKATVEQTMPSSALKIAVQSQNTSCPPCEEYPLIQMLLPTYRLIASNIALSIVQRVKKITPTRPNILLRAGPSSYHVYDGVFQDKIASYASVEELMTNLSLRENDAKNPEVRVIHKHGAWVYLNKGRGYGLKIRDRLIAGDDIRMHIVSHYSADEKIKDQDHLVHDGAIAYVRKGQDLVKIGDIVQFDPTEYPTPFPP